MQMINLVSFVGQYDRVRYLTCSAVKVVESAHLFCYRICGLLYIVQLIGLTLLLFSYFSYIKRMSQSKTRFGYLLSFRSF